MIFIIIIAKCCITIVFGLGNLMLSNEDILKLDTRRDIYNLVLENPGLHLREISRRINLSFGGLRYQLNYLEKKGLIKTDTNQRFTRYYATNQIDRNDKEILNLLRQDIPRILIMLLFVPYTKDVYKNNETKRNKPKIQFDSPSYPKAHSKAELIELTRYWKGPESKLFYLNLYETTVGFHLNKLLKADIIEKVRIGREVKYKLKDTDKIFTILLIYHKELSDESINTFLNWCKVFRTNKLNSYVDILWEICPHPYHV